jgi:hypothetical protein
MLLRVSVLKMFKVMHKDSNTKYQVFDVKYDASGNAHFLIFVYNQFTTCHSKHFKPVKEFLGL